MINHGYLLLVAVWLTALIVALAVATWGGALFFAVLFARRALAATPQQPAMPPAPRSATELEPPAEGRPDDLLYLDSAHLLLPDYADVATLSSIAAELGINVDPTNVERGIAVADSTSVVAQIEGQMSIPHVASVGSKIEADTSTSHVHTEVVSTLRRSTAAELLTAVCNGLHERARLRLDLLDFPTDSKQLRSLVVAVADAWRSWDIAPVASTGGEDTVPSTGDQAASVAEPAEPVDPNERVRDALKLVSEEAIRRLYDEKEKQLRELAEDPRAEFALAMGTWTSWRPTENRAELWSIRLYAPPAYSEIEWIRVLNLVRVILDSEHMTRFGEHRFKHGAEVGAIVFGKIGTMTDDLRCLNVVPLMIYPLSAR